MKKSKERTLLIAVLSVAGVALLVDRVILDSGMTGPAESSAGVLDGFAVDPSVPDQAILTDQAHATTPTSRFAERLREVSERSPATDPAQGRDAFTPAQGWSVSVSQGSPGNSAKLAKQFRASHRLDAVMIIGDRHCAVIDGQTVFVGQEIDGYKLQTVHQRSAVFQVGGVSVKIGISSGLPSS